MELVQLDKNLLYCHRLNFGSGGVEPVPPFFEVACTDATSKIAVFEWFVTGYSSSQLHFLSEFQNKHSQFSFFPQYSLIVAQLSEKDIVETFLQPRDYQIAK